MELLFKLIIGHAIADFALQSDFVAMNKGRSSKIPQMWPYVLASHCLFHGGFVYLFTGSAALGLAETIAHAGIDFLKCEQKISLHVDQALHLTCKILWVYLTLG